MMEALLTVKFEVVALSEEAQAGGSAVSVLLRHEGIAYLHHPALKNIEFWRISSGFPFKNYGPFYLNYRSCQTQVDKEE